MSESKMNEENNNTEQQRDVIYLVVNDDMIAIASAHWKTGEAMRSKSTRWRL